MVSDAVRLLRKQTFQLTLAILKPDICSLPALRDVRSPLFGSKVQSLTSLPRLHLLLSQRQEVIQLMLSHEFLFICSKRMHLSMTQAQQFYAEHEERFFFNRLTQFMTGGPISVHILGRNDAIRTWRELLGPTKVTRAQFEAPDSIRGRYGVTDTRNVAHGSDSIANALQEMNFFFPDFDSLFWLQQKMPHFMANSVEYDPEEEVHKVK